MWYIDKALMLAVIFIHCFNDDIDMSVIETINQCSAERMWQSDPNVALCFTGTIKIIFKVQRYTNSRAPEPIFETFYFIEVLSWGMTVKQCISCSVDRVVFLEHVKRLRWSYLSSINLLTFCVGEWASKFHGGEAVIRTRWYAEPIWPTTKTLSMKTNIPGFRF